MAIKERACGRQHKGVCKDEPEAIREKELPLDIFVCPSCHLAWWPGKSELFSPSVRVDGKFVACRDCERTMVPYSFDSKRS